MIDDPHEPQMKAPKGRSGARPRQGRGKFTPGSRQGTCATVTPMTYSRTITPVDETVRAQAVEPLSRAAAELPPLIWPESAEFDVARQACNLHSEQRPACVCVATRVEHVQAAVTATSRASTRARSVASRAWRSHSASWAREQARLEQLGGLARVSQPLRRLVAVAGAGE
jgi:hypothetical protein